MSSRQIRGDHPCNLPHNPSMTYPLGSLNADGGDDRRHDPATSLRLTGRLHRQPASATTVPSTPVETTFRFQASLLIGALAWILLLLAMISHNRLDAAFSTSGLNREAANWVGHLGALASDLLYCLLGFSGWWTLIIGGRVWLSAFARWLRRDPALAHLGQHVPGADYPRWRFWLGVALLLSASCALEWTRLYRVEPAIAGEHAGGILGLVLGPLSTKWLGFNGSGVL